MLRPVSTHSAGLTIIAASFVTLSACTLEKDDNGGRPAGGTTPVTATTVASPPVSVTRAEPETATRGTGPTVRVEFDLAEIAYRDKRYGEARELFALYVAERPANPWGHYMLGLASWKTGDLAGAETAFRRSLELDPRHVKALHNLSRVLLEQERATEARKSVLAALALDSGSAEGYRLLGRVHAALKQNDEAIAAYRLALHHDPSDAWSMNNLGLILVQQRRFDEALPALARAVQIDATVPVFQNNLGIALEHLGQYTQATSAYRSALAADSGYVKAVLSLARVEFRAQDPALAPVDLGVLAGNFDREVRLSPVSVAVARR